MGRVVCFQGTFFGLSKEHLFFVSSFFRSRRIFRHTRTKMSDPGVGGAASQCSTHWAAEGFQTVLEVPLKLVLKRSGSIEIRLDYDRILRHGYTLRTYKHVEFMSVPSETVNISLLSLSPLLPVTTVAGTHTCVCLYLQVLHDWVAVDPSAKSLAFCGSNGKP